jgi:hypothetical protein
LVPVDSVVTDLVGPFRQAQAVTMRQPGTTDPGSSWITARLTADGRIARPLFVWLAIPIELITAVGAVPVGWSLITDPSGSGIGLPSDWIARSVFATYFIPGIYLLLMNGLGMLLAAGLTLYRHWFAPWWTGTLAVGLIVWILVQFVLMPQTSPLQWFFLASGIALGFIAMFWLRRTGQLKLW